MTILLLQLSDIYIREPGNHDARDQLRRNYAAVLLTMRIWVKVISYSSA